MNRNFLFLLWGGFILIYLVGIYDTPIFEDEAEYLLLADQIIKDPFKNFLIYLQNGIFPGFGWLVAVVTKFTGDSLVAGRALNILLASTLIFFVIKWSEIYKLSNRFTVGAILLLITSPALLLNARIGLLDTSVLVFTAWYIYFTAKLLKNPSTVDYAGLFTAISLAFLTKPNAIFGLPVALGLILFDTKLKRLKTTHFKIAGMYILGLSFPAIFYFLFYRQIHEVTGSSFVSFDDLVLQIKQNIFLTSHWFKIYYVQYLIPLLVLPFFFKSLKKTSIYLLMAVWIVGSLLGMIIFNRFYFPRHTLMVVLPLIIIAAGLVAQMQKKAGIVMFVLIILFSFNLSWKIITQLSSAPLALEDKFSYFENYTSGVTIDDISSDLRVISYKEPITVWLDGSYVLEYGLRRELDSSNIYFKSFRLDENFFPHEPKAVYKDPGRTTYAIVNRRSPQNVHNLEFLKSFTVSFRHGQNLYLVP